MPRFSSRLGWDVEPNRLSAALEARRAAGAEVLDLTQSNPTKADLDYPAVEIAAALDGARALTYEPHPAGLPAAREAVSAYYAARGQAIAPDRILLTASTSEAYGYLFKLFCDPGDEVLVPRPSYPLFEYLAALELTRVVQYPLFYDHGWHFDPHAIEQRITPRTRALVAVNPNNPTGSYLKRGELADLAGLCAAHDLALISDEVFFDYAFGGDADRASAVSADAFTLNGLSKALGLPQLKLGWIALGGAAAAALPRLELIADTYLSVGTPVQAALPRLLALARDVQGRIRARTRTNLDLLRDQLAGSAAHVLRLEGGWSAVLRVPRLRSEEEWALALLDAGVLVQPGYFYDFDSEAFLVVSLLTPEAVFAAGVRRLRARLQ